jgi:hypothetical protein
MLITEAIVKGFDISESSSIRVVKKLLSHSTSGNFGAKLPTNTRLEPVVIQVPNCLYLVWGAERQTAQARGKIAERVKSKYRKFLF